MASSGEFFFLYIMCVLYWDSTTDTDRSSSLYFSPYVETHFLSFLWCTPYTFHFVVWNMSLLWRHWWVWLNINAKTFAMNWVQILEGICIKFWKKSLFSLKLHFLLKVLEFFLKQINLIVLKKHFFNFKKVLYKNTNKQVITIVILQALQSCILLVVSLK